MPIADFSLKGKVAVVTGASRGIGEAIARGFAEQGATVIISSRKQEALDPVAESINADGGSCTAIACHAGDPDAIGRLFERIKADHGRVDVLVNNAATNPYFGTALDIDMGAYDKTFDVNVKGYFLMCQEAGKLMVKQGSGSMINVASIGGITPGPMQGVYSMTKAAVISMTKVFARELGADNVRSNAICPGLVETHFASVLVNTPEIHAEAIKMIPLNRHAQPSEMVGLAIYLASDASSFTTGGIFVADGGMIA